MSNELGMAAQLAGQGLRFGWYFALNRVVDWRTSQLGLDPPLQADPPGALDAGAAGRAGPAADGRCAGRARRALSADGGRQRLAPAPSRARAPHAGRPAVGPAAPRRVGRHQRQGRARGRRRARLLCAGLPLPDRRLPERGLRAALRHPGRDAVHGRRRPHAPDRAAPDRRVHGRPRPAPDGLARRRLRHGSLPAPGAARVSGDGA